MSFGDFHPDVELLMFFVSLSMYCLFVCLSYFPGPVFLKFTTFI